MVQAETSKGTCEGCGKSPRVLTHIESGQWVCRSCLREIRGEGEECTVLSEAPEAAVVVEPAEATTTRGRVNHRSVHVAGVSHANRDGTSRQKIISRCALGEILRMVGEPTNPVDPNAVAVVRLNGEQIGYLSRDDAADVVRGSQRGWLYLGIINWIGNDGVRGHCLGVGMTLVFATDGTDKATVQGHVAALVKKYQARG
jgi:ribosomal protein L37AE/L43A